MSSEALEAEFERRLSRFIQELQACGPDVVLKPPHTQDMIDLAQGRLDLRHYFYRLRPEDVSVGAWRQLRLSGFADAIRANVPPESSLGKCALEVAEAYHMILRYERFGHSSAWRKQHGFE